MSNDLDPHEFYKTNDMALATYLKLESHTPQMLEWQGTSCYWIFRVSDSLLELVEKFASDEALVNPKEYNRIFTHTKREFYDSKDRH